jgi:Domain of unknown function (DUF4192)
MTPKLTLRDPADVAAAVPYLLGFHPTDSLVVIGLRDGGAAMVQRWDLDADAEGLAAAMAQMIQPSGAQIALLAGFGPAESVRPVVRRLCRILTIPVHAAVRVADGRCFCELCDTCTPPGGIPYDVTSSRVAAQATVAGLTALPSRAALADLVAPPDGLAAAAMSAAVGRADGRLHELLDAARTPTDPVGATALHEQGILAVDDAFAAALGGRRLDDDQVAWLTLLLHSLPIRDHAWQLTDHEDWHLRLWTDLTRRADPALVAPCAALLGFAAWRAGDGPLASVALERALRCDPDYSLAGLLRDAMFSGVPGSVLADWPDAGRAGRPAHRDRPPSRGRRRPGRANRARLR